MKLHNCCGNTIVRQVIMKNRVLVYWYECLIDGEWLMFDIREIARRTGVVAPELFTKADLDAVFAGKKSMTTVNIEDLNMVTSYCDAVDAITVIKAIYT